VLRDMNSMAEVIVGVGGQAAGAGQLQIYFDAGISPDRRDKAFVELVDGYSEAIDAILSEANQ
jgi:hypothetical protein